MRACSVSETPSMRNILKILIPLTIEEVIFSVLLIYLFVYKITQKDFDLFWRNVWSVMKNGDQTNKWFAKWIVSIHSIYVHEESDISGDLMLQSQLWILLWLLNFRKTNRSIRKKSLLSKYFFLFNFFDFWKFKYIFL